MCRHVGYLGPPRTLHSLVYAPPHGLEHQSYAARLCGHGALNADGFGVAWYAPRRRTPVRYRRAQPMWTDVSFADVADVVSTRCALAAVRSATVGFPVDESGAQPFVGDHRLFSHNGRIEGFPAVEGKLRELAHTAIGASWHDVPDVRAPLDSALVFALTVGAWRSGASLVEGLAATVATIDALADARLNLLACDGRSLAATAAGDSLFVAQCGDSALIASEPLDDERNWQRVPDRRAVTATDEGDRVAVTVAPLH